MANYTLRELVGIFDVLLVDLPPMFLVETEIFGKDCLAFAEDRNVRTGLDANGAPHKPYTFPYQQNKEELGRFRGHVDFQLTGQMLASTDSGLVNIVPTERALSGANARVVFDGRDPETRNKLAGNDKKRPGFMNPSKAEVDKASGFAGKRIEKNISKRFA